MSILNRLKGKATYQVTFSYTPPVMGFIKPTVTTSEPVLSRKSDIPSVIESCLNSEYGLPISNLQILDVKEP